jgi:DNA-binding NarL/FixJ family response regulator
MPAPHARQSEHRDGRERARGDAGARSPAPIRVLIVDAHAMFAQGLARLLDDEPDLRSVGFARTIGDAIRIAERTEPGLVLLDIELHRREPSGGVGAMRKAAPAAEILLLATAEPSSLRAEAVEAGAAGIVSKRSDVGLLIAGIRQAAEGGRTPGRAAPPATLKRRVPKGRSSESAGGPAALTARELEILTALASGLGTVEVADALHISPLTVRSHVKNILSKLGVHSKLEAVTLAIRGGLVRVDRTA